MKLSTDAINNLNLLIQTTFLAGISKLIIDSNKICGINDQQTVAIITSNNVPDFQGKKIGISRLNMLDARMNLVKSVGDLNIDATESNNGQEISILDISSGKTKAQFRCSSMDNVKGVPKNIADNLVWEIQISNKLLPTLNQGFTAMSSENIIIASKDGKNVSFEYVDSNKDIFTMDGDGDIKWIGDGDAQSSFCQKYPTKAFLSLLKEISKTSDTITMKIGAGGILQLMVNGFDFFVIPAK